MRPKKLLALVLSLVMVVSMFTITATTVSAENTGKIKNVIYLIPDGGGMAPYNLAAALKEAGGWGDGVYPYATKQTVNKMYLDDYLVGGETTYAADNPVTDSAASGTALAGGYKTNVGSIGVDPLLRPHANILEASQFLNKKTGMVTTYEWTNATPAAFSAHSANRTYYPEMSEQIVNQGIDVVLGTGFGKAQWGSINEASNRGYTIINNRADLNAVKQGDKIWGNLFSSSSPADISNSSTTPTLAEMTTAAIRALENDNGFFLMVEGSQVDGGGHGNNSRYMVGDFIAFDEACKVAIEYAKGRNDTVVVVLPDHDTGGMTVLDEAGAVARLRQGLEPTGEQVTWETTYHTGRNGGVFMYVPEGVDYIPGLSKTPGVASNFQNYVINNIDVAPYLAGLFGVNLDEVTKELFVDITTLGTYIATTDGNSSFFTFSDVDCTIARNASVATINGETVSLNGQVAVYIDGRFYAPKMLLDILGLEVPLTWNGNVKAEYAFNGYEGGFDANTYQSISFTNGGTTTNTTITPGIGDFATYTFNAPYSGIYGMQIDCSAVTSRTTIRVISGDYYADFDISKTGWTNASSEDQPMYFSQGANTLTVQNLGPGSISMEGFDFGRLDKTGFDSMDYMPLVKSIHDEDYDPGVVTLITSESITNMGTADTLWDNVFYHNGATENGDAFDLAAGGWVSFQVPVSTAGIYYSQITSQGGDTTLRVQVDGRYYEKLPVGAADGDYYLNQDGDYAFLYVPKGTISVKIVNEGDQACTISDVQFVASQRAVDAGVTPTMSDVKAMKEWVYAAQNQDGYFNDYTSDGEPNVTLAPGNFATVTVTDIPYTGIYAFQLRLPTVNGTANVRVTTDRGYYGDYAITEADTWTNRMTPPQDQPLYFTAGTNTFYIENTGTTSFYLKEYDIGRMDDGNSMDFAYLLKQTDKIPGSGTVVPTPTPTPPISGDISAWTGRFSDVTSHKNGYIGENYAMTTFTKSNGTSSVAGVDYQATSGAPFGSNGTFTMIVGDWGKYEITVPYTGVYAMQLRIVWISGSGTTTLKVSTEDGYYTEQTFTQTGWSSGSYADQPIYLKAGKNVITVELVGPNNCTLSAIDLGRLDVNGADASLDYLPLVKTESVVEPTPTPTPAATPEGITTESIDMPGSAASVWENVTNQSATGISGTTSRLAINAGAEAHFRITAPQTGFYYLQIKARNGDTTLRTEVDPVAGQPTYYAEMPVAVTTQFYNKNADGAYEFMYLTEGEHQLVLKNMGEVNCRVERLELKASIETYEVGTTPTMADCKTYLPKDTKGFYTLDTTDTTATVSYTKYTNDNPKVMFVMASYDGNKLVGINLTEIDISKQEAGTTVNYTVSLEGATGTTKTMLLTENLVPLF